MQDFAGQLPQLCGMLGVSWETWVAVAEHTRKLIPVENRKQAGFMI